MIIRRRRRGHLDTAVWPGVTVCLAYAGYGLGMLLQPNRFRATPAYGNLTQVLNIQTWGWLHLVVAVLFAAYITFLINRLMGILVHIYAIAIAGAWFVAFVIRWCTDHSTTVVNIVSWGVLLLLMGRSAALVPVVTDAEGHRERH